MIRKLNSLAAIALLSTLLAPVGAQASFEFGFSGITNNNATNTAIGQAQLKVDVSDAGGGLVLFRFNNYGPAASSITDVYFDDATPAYFSTTIASIQNVSGVTFTTPATPGNLPGGTSVGFASNISANSVTPIMAQGVNPGEVLGLRIDDERWRTARNVRMTYSLAR